MLLTSVSDGRIGRIAMAREPVNALSTEMMRRLTEAFDEMSRRDDVSVVLLTSACDKCFCAGADIKELHTLVTSGDPTRDEQRQLIARQMFDAVANNTHPVIAVMNGPALGAGAVLAANCDVRYASDRVTVGLPEINVGRCGGGRHMMRLLPQGRLRQMYFTGKPIDADEALRLGFLDRVLPTGLEEQAATELAQEIAGKSPLALRLAKQALNGCEALPVSEGYAFEQKFTLQLARSEDAREATQAFLEKRAPVWSGR